MPLRLLAALTLTAAVLASQPLAVAAEEDPVVATVNGVSIHLSDVEEAAMVLPDQYRQLPMDTLYPHLVDRLIRMQLLAADGRRRGLDDTDQFAQRLERARNRLLEQAAVDTLLDERLDDAALRARYDRFAAERGQDEEVHARHILLADMAAAEQVIRELDGGADFAELAKERSTGPSGPSGGDLGYFQRGQMVPAFEQAAFGMAAGTHSAAPVQTQFGWHVIKVEDRRVTPVPAFEAVADQLRAELAREIEDAYVDGLKADAEIQTYTPDGVPVP